ncbi:hypothetical protein TRIATDRAFT_37550 [Trichoderma atroviride IMI 206040]|uniref:Helicase-like protein n=2 Tax=Hypocrea atroviridis TaxID=63577 RepID=G9NY58_HYPAI|nr:uncharacterized protein TRIATDRAFT_37550 [Trichoderma atroviride IMI 206040]EHK44385.1 hypothetical protein TRIATDRAFT_37550 [Trichoderma atroviride IMI 206040]
MQAAVPTQFLSDDDVEKLFSGAPQYFARSESHFPGAPHPSVAFPFDEELEIRDLTDHVQIEAKAWRGVTVWPHLTRDVNHDPEAKQEVEDTRKAHFHVRCCERPNMLSMQGLEKGTMGYQAALELAVSDSLEEEQFGFESLGTKARAVVEARERMLSRDGWLHRLPQGELLDRLRRNGEIYRNNDFGKKPSTETYNDLFHVLMRPNKIPPVDKKDSHSLPNQISAILKCMGAPNVWIDLSHVEWRVRLGQILWGKPHGDELDDSTAIVDAESSAERAEEKYWLLMQILVSSELLIRLDAITDGEEYGAAHFRAIDVVQFERAANASVKWSLLLARSWLNNIEILREDYGSLATRPEPRRGSSGVAPGWLASLASKISLHDQHKHGNRPPSPPHFYTIRGRYGQRQVEGLTHFARKLMWPGIDGYERRISEKVQKLAAPSSLLQPPTPTPYKKEPEQDSYFGAWDVTCQRGHHKERARARRRRMAAALHESGWLSKSYVFGLMMPGDAVSHFLMATLLENDSEALSRIGSFANLSSGFVYHDKSFWSTSCIVGRVLAAGKGSAECMGWISTDIIPEGVTEGWISIDVHDVASDLSQLGKKGRIWGKKRVERESYILGNGDEESISPADFIIPHENNYAPSPPGVFVELQSLELDTPVAECVHPTPLAEIIATPIHENHRAPDLLSYPAKINFFVSIDGEKTETITLSLLYDINFVTAHPCSPSSRVRVLKSPSSPTLQQIDFTGTNALGAGSRSMYRAGHPLHKYYNYTVIHISELLKRRDAELSDLLTPPGGQAAQNQVLVVDCITNFSSVPTSPVADRSDSPGSSPIERKGSFSAAAKMHFESRKRQFGSDMEILIRALCSQRGWNAIISRRKRGCLACAIREAGALGWKLIIRVP